MTQEYGGHLKWSFRVIKKIQVKCLKWQLCLSLWGITLQWKLNWPQCNDINPQPYRRKKEFPCLSNLTFKASK